MLFLNVKIKIWNVRKHNLKLRIPWCRNFFFTRLIFPVLQFFHQPFLHVSHPQCVKLAHISAFEKVDLPEASQFTEARERIHQEVVGPAVRGGCKLHIMSRILQFSLQIVGLQKRRFCSLYVDSFIQQTRQSLSERHGP